MSLKQFNKGENMSDLIIILEAASNLEKLRHTLSMLALHKRNADVFSLSAKDIDCVNSDLINATKKLIELSENI